MALALAAPTVMIPMLATIVIIAMSAAAIMGSSLVGFVSPLYAYELLISRVPLCLTDIGYISVVRMEGSWSSTKS